MSNFWDFKILKTFAYNPTQERNLSRSTEKNRKIQLLLALIISSALQTQCYRIKGSENENKPFAPWLLHQCCIRLFFWLPFAFFFGNGSWGFFFIFYTFFIQYNFFALTWILSIRSNGVKMSSKLIYSIFILPYFPIVSLDSQHHYFPKKDCKIATFTKSIIDVKIHLTFIDNISYHGR